MRTLHGLLTNGYPNLFIIGQSQGAWTANYTQLLDEASRHVAAIVAHMEKEGLATVEPTPAAEDAWAAEIVARAVNGTGGIGGSDCTPGYYNNEGQPLDGPPWGASYGRGPIQFFRLMEAWRASGDFAGAAFSPRPTGAAPSTGSHPT
jgi:cyclohexanone monooxygenase